MAKTAIIKTTLTTFGDGISDAFTDTPLSSSSSVYKDETLSLSNGDNTITPPSGATYLYLSSGTVVLKISGALAATGWNIGSGKSALIPLGGGTYIINATGAGTVEAKWRS